jgi:O-antigen/teichoic acid export membrane protein
MIIDMVMFPTIARAQSDIGKVREMYVKFRDISTSVSTILTVYLYIFSETIITIVLGAKWTYLDSSFKLLIISFGFGMETIFSTMFLKALGRLREIMVLRTVSCIASASLLIMFAKFGLVGIAFGMSISTFLVWFLTSVMVFGVLEDNLLQALLPSLNRFARIVLVFGAPLYRISLAVGYLKYNNIISCVMELLFSVTLLIFVVMKVPAVFGGSTIRVLLKVCENVVGKKNIIYTQLAKAVGSCS